MSRRFLFCAGEWQASMPVVFADEEWSHTTFARMLLRNDDGTLSRNNVVERLEGVIYYASVENKEIRRHNLYTLARQNVPCWPNPAKLLRIDNRFTLLKECVDAGFVDHPVVFVTYDQRGFFQHLKMPYVLKVGNCHQGEGKILVTSQKEEDMLEPWKGVASREPFFDGESIRVLFIGKDTFLQRFTNNESWIKNSAGADVEFWGCAEFNLVGFMGPVVRPMVKHACKVRDYFDLEVCGIDYIIDKEGKFHFLEYNCFPGVGSHDDIIESARKLFRQKMDIVASEANSRSEQHLKIR